MCHVQIELGTPHRHLVGRALTLRHEQTSTPRSAFASRHELYSERSSSALKTSKMLGSVSEGAVDEECMAEAK